MHSHTSQRDAVVSQNLGLVSYCVHNVQTKGPRAGDVRGDDLYQVGANTLIRLAHRHVGSSAIDNFSAYARKSMMVAMREHVAEWYYGAGYRKHPPNTFEVRLDTGSQIANAQPMVMPQAGNSFWVRDTIGLAPEEIQAKFASAGYPVEGRAQMTALCRRLGKMVP